MNFSLTSGKPIAFYKDKKGKTQIINVIDDSNNKDKDNIDLTQEEIVDMVEDFIRNTKGRISMKTVDELQKSLKNKTEPTDEKLKELYKKLLTSKKTKSILIEDSEVMPMFDPDDERIVYHIAGMAGSGKSTMVGKMIENYHKIHPNNKIWFFSNKSTDPAIDKFDYVNRIIINDELLDDPIVLDELRDSFVIFDDVECLPDKKISKELDRIRDLILQQGRSYHITFAYITHLLNNYKDTRLVLHECHRSIIYPKMTTAYSLKYLLEKYYGLDKDEIAKLRNLNSRWVCLSKNPPCIIHNKGAYMVD